MKELVTASSLDRKPFFFFFFKSLPLRAPLPLLQQPTDNFITVASKVEATIMIRAEIVLKVQVFFVLTV